MSEVEDLRRELDDLDKQRGEVESRLRGLRQHRAERGRGARGGPSSREEHLRRRQDADLGVKRRRGADEDEYDRQKSKPKIMSAIVALGSARTSRDDERPGMKRAERYDDDIPIEKPETRGAYKNPETVDRNRRMFGALMGHLGSASKRLKQDSNLLEKQDKVQKDVLQKADEEAVRLKELQRRIFQEEQEKELRARDELLAQQKRAEVRLLQAAFKRQHAPMRQFILTQTEPRILYLPARHNDATSELLATQAAEIEKKIAQREEQDKEKLQEIDRYVPNEVERRKVRRDEAKERYARKQRGEEEPTDADGQNESNHHKDDQESDEDIDALERELDTGDMGLDTLNGRNATTEEDKQENEGNGNENGHHEDEQEQATGDVADEDTTVSKPEPEAEAEAEAAPTTTTTRRRSTRKRST